MSMKTDILKKVILLCGIFLALCALPKTALASVLDSYGDGKVYDVTVYGADKTGASSSSQAVLDAVAQARKDLDKGNMDGKSRAVIYFPSGTYNLSEGFKLFSDMVIAAESDTVIQASGTAVDITHRSNVAVEGGTWKSSGSSYLIKDTDSDMTIKNLTITKGSTGLLFCDAAITAENITISGCTSIGIQNTGGTLSLSNINISGAKTGLALFGGKVTMSAVSVTGCPGLGITISRNAAVTAESITANNNGSGYPKKGYLGQGIGVYSGSKLTISNSTISSNRECGISIAKGTVTATNCTLENNGRHAVGTDKVCTLVMTNCTINKNGQKDNYDGISVVDGSKATLTNCTITSSATTGLLLTGGGTSATVKNCTFKGNKSQNIYVENLDSSKKAKLTVNGGKFYKTKSSYSIRVHVKKTSQYSVTLKGSIKYYNKIKKGYTLWIGNKMTHKKK